MPLHDHFHSPWIDQDYWESFHDAWINTLVRHLNGSLLPKKYRALPQVHLGIQAAPDVGAMERNGNSAPEQKPSESEGGAIATAVWAPPTPAQTLTVSYPDQDVFEVRVLDESRGLRLVGALELVSPRNKDQPESRQTFVAKCVGYLQQRVGLTIVDVVTSRRTNFHHELQQLLSPHERLAPLGDLYAVAYRDQEVAGNGHSRLSTWPSTLEIGKPLPTLPLWLTDGPAIPIDLETTYEETCKVLRIEHA